MRKKEGLSLCDYGCRLKEGKEITLNLSVSTIETSDCFQNDMAALIQEQNLSQLLEESIALEKRVFDQLQKKLEAEWADVAYSTQCIKLAQEYLAVRPVEHTNNQWILNENTKDMYEISNSTYRFYYRIYVREIWDRDAKKSIPTSWDVSWGFLTNAPDVGQQNNIRIDGQQGKKCKSAEAAHNYVNGRFKKYQKYFVEVCPPVSDDLKQVFMCNGLLLPGYKLANVEE